MTPLQYRGFPCTPTPQQKRVPMPMMYRGVAHDGVPQNLARNSGAKMAYRGIAYIRAAAGQIVPIEKTARSTFGTEAFAG